MSIRSVDDHSECTKKFQEDVQLVILGHFEQSRIPDSSSGPLDEEWNTESLRRGLQETDICRICAAELEQSNLQLETRAEKLGRTLEMLRSEAPETLTGKQLVKAFAQSKARKRRAMRMKGKEAEKRRAMSASKMDTSGDDGEEEEVTEKTTGGDDDLMNTDEEETEDDDGDDDGESFSGQTYIIVSRHWLRTFKDYATKFQQRCQRSSKYFLPPPVLKKRGRRKTVSRGSSVSDAPVVVDLTQSPSRRTPQDPPLGLGLRLNFLNAPTVRIPSPELPELLQERMNQDLLCQHGQFEVEDESLSCLTQVSWLTLQELTEFRPILPEGFPEAKEEESGGEGGEEEGREATGITGEEFWTVDLESGESPCLENRCPECAAAAQQEANQELSQRRAVLSELKQLKPLLNMKPTQFPRVHGDVQLGEFRILPWDWLERWQNYARAYTSRVRGNWPRPGPVNLSALLCDCWKKQQQQRQKQGKTGMEDAGEPPRKRQATSSSTRSRESMADDNAAEPEGKVTRGASSPQQQPSNRPGLSIVVDGNLTQGVAAWIRPSQWEFILDRYGVDTLEFPDVEVISPSSSPSSSSGEATAAATEEASPTTSSRKRKASEPSSSSSSSASSFSSSDDGDERNGITGLREIPLHLTLSPESEKAAKTAQLDGKTWQFVDAHTEPPACRRCVRTRMEDESFQQHFYEGATIKVRRMRQHVFDRLAAPVLYQMQREAEEKKVAAPEADSLSSLPSAEQKQTITTGPEEATTTVVKKEEEEETSSASMAADAAVVADGGHGDDGDEDDDETEDEPEFEQILKPKKPQQQPPKQPRGRKRKSTTETEAAAVHFTPLESQIALTKLLYGPNATIAGQPIGRSRRGAERDLIHVPMISSQDRLMEFQLKLMEVSDVEPEQQNLYLGVTPLLKSQLTLEQLGVKLNHEIILIVSDRSRTGMENADYFEMDAAEESAFGASVLAGLG